jgi:hypothetical protein
MGLWRVPPSLPSHVVRLTLVAAILAACAEGESLSEPPRGGSSGGSGGSAGAAGAGGNSTGKGGTSGSTGSGGGGSGGTSGGSAGTSGSGGTAGTSGSGGGGSGGTAGTSGSANSAGEGGVPADGGAAGSSTNGCGTIPLKSTWVALRSTTGGDAASQAVDADVGTRFSTGADQAAGMWLQVDFGVPTAISEVTLYSSAAGDYPRGYEVIVSDTHANTAGTPAATGTQAANINTIEIPFGNVVTGRYLLIVLTATADVWWSVHDLNVACE